LCCAGASHDYALLIADTHDACRILLSCVLYDAAGFSDDYALLIAGLLDLYEAGGGLGWLQWAVRLQDTLDSLFWDSSSGEY
jgi:uncharacterized protein YyaL (SSP411 family)